MPELAQTNIQLCNQLTAAGWSGDDLTRLRRAYELAMVIFAGQFRANGKTQIAHHVGVTSAVAAQSDRRDLVLAALVHSAYFLGEWGEGRLAITPTKRARLRAVAGEGVEDLVLGYTELDWSLDAVQALDARAPSFADRERELVLMRLANEIDEFCDGGKRYVGDAHHRDGLGESTGVHAMVSLAQRAGLEPVGARLRAVFDAANSLPVDDVLVTEAADSMCVPPLSYRRRWHIALQDSKVGHAVAAHVPGARELAAYARQKLA
ncbi:MAG: DUF6817 domain-containing protein [Acidimicrobiia bacterium]